MAIIILLLLLCGQVLAVHDPAIPDTIFVSTVSNNRDGFTKGANTGAFLTLRGLGTGTATISNSASAAERGITWYNHTSAADSMARAYWYGEALGNGGTFKAQLTNSFRADSSFWSVKYEGEIDSGYAADSVFVIASFKQVSNPGQILASHYNDVYTGATDGYDTTKYVAFKRNTGTNRATVKLNDVFTDSLESWIGNASEGSLSPKIAMVGASDFRIDSLSGDAVPTPPSTDNTLEACAFYFSENAYADRPYILFYWTDTTPTATNKQNRWRRGSWR